MRSYRHPPPIGTFTRSSHSSSAPRCSQQASPQTWRRDSMLTRSASNRLARQNLLCDLFDGQWPWAWPRALAEAQPAKLGVCLHRRVDQVEHVAVKVRGAFSPCVPIHAVVAHGLHAYRLRFGLCKHDGRPCCTPFKYAWGHAASPHTLLTRSASRDGISFAGGCPNPLTRPACGSGCPAGLMPLSRILLPTCV